MKSVLVLALFALPLSTALLAQEPAATSQPRLRAPAPTPPSSAEAAPMPAVEPEVSLIPDEVPQNAKPAPTKSEPKSKTEQSAEEMMERIHFREAQTKALRDPQIQAEWARAHKAKTDYEKREALKSYYKLLHARIVKIDSSVKNLSALREKISLRRLEQTRIDPTEPLDPTERNERFDRATEQ